MKHTQVHPSDTEDPTLEGIRHIAEDLGSELILAWLDALVRGERARSSHTQPTPNGLKDARFSTG